MTMPAPRGAPLRADCVADSAGGLTFDVAAGGASGAVHLVLRHREGKEEVSLPLTPSADGCLRAALPSSVPLPEGDWDVYSGMADDETRRLAPGLMDVRLEAARVPYETRQGNLSIRCRVRPTPSRGAGNGATSHDAATDDRRPTQRSAYASATESNGT